jgi:phage tail sheath gpL-like
MLPASAISRVTGVNVEFRNFNAGRAAFLPQRLAVIGIGNTDAVYSTEKYEALGSAGDIGARFGYGSPLHLAARQLFPDGGGAAFPVTFYPLIPAESAQAAAGAITCDGTAAAAGSGTVRIGGINAEFAVTKNNTAAHILASIKTTIASKLDMPVFAGEVSGDSLEITAKWEGDSGNDIAVSIIADIPGITLGVTAMTGGSLDPDVTDALGKIGQAWETFVLSCFSWNKPSRLDAYQTYGEGRWSQLEKKPLLVAHGCTDDFETRTAITDTRKTDYINFLIPSVGSGELPFVIAAKGLVNDIMTNANENPPLGYSGLLTGLIAGSDDAQENYATRNNSVLKGSSTNIKNGSVAELNDIITFYHPDNEATPSKRYVVDLVKLMNVVFNVRLIMESTEDKGAPLVSDDTPTKNPRAVQPKTVRTVMMNLANSLASFAIIQEPEFTKKNLTVDIDSQNPKRLNTKYPVKLSGNVEVTSSDIYFGFYLGGE